jgi:hypothetical protein
LKNNELKPNKNIVAGSGTTFIFEAVNPLLKSSLTKLFGFTDDFRDKSILGDESLTVSVPIVIPTASPILSNTRL